MILCRETDPAALEDRLRTAGIRVTRPRAAILQVLARTPGAIGAAELNRRARALDPALSLATVYRTLALLDRIGATEHAGSGPDGTRLVDIDGGAGLEIHDARLDRLLAEIAAEHGLEIVGHRVELRCRRR